MCLAAFDVNGVLFLLSFNFSLLLEVGPEPLTPKF